MSLATGRSDGLCPWKGKKLTELALGKLKVICSAIMEATTPRYQQMMLTTPLHVSGRVSRIVTNVKTRFCQEVSSKLGYTERIPYKAAGIFGEAFGYSLAECKACTIECFAQYDAIEDKSMADKVSVDLFGRATLESMQLEAFAFSPKTRLHLYPDAWCECQVISFTVIIEQATEGEHRDIHLHSKHGFKHQLPASTCAAKRHGQNIPMLEDPDFMYWAVGNWYTRARGKFNLWHNVLEHMMPPGEIDKLSMSQKHATAYLYSLTQQYGATAGLQQVVSDWTSVQEKSSKQPDVPTTPQGQLVIDYLKNKLLQGLVYSMPAAFVEEASQANNSADSVAVPPAGIDQILDALRQQHHAGQTDDVNSLTFFTVVDARPESKSYIRPRHIARTTTTMAIAVHPLLQWNASGITLNQQSLPAQIIDLRHWWAPADFAAIMLKTWSWDLCMTARRITEKPCRLLDVPMSANFGRPFVPQITAPVDVPDDTTLVDPASGAVFGGQSTLAVATPPPPLHAFAPEERDFLKQLVDGRYFEEDGKSIPLWQVQNWELELLESLESRGIVKVVQDCDGFETEVSLVVANVSVQVVEIMNSPKHIFGRQSGGKKAVALEKYSKLELVEVLLDGGWQSDRDALDAGGWYAAADEKVFVLGNLFRSQAYFLALVRSAEIFAKPGGLQHIYHHLPEQYFKCLLNLDDLSPITQLGETVEWYSNADFKKICDGEEGIAQRAALQALGDAEDDDGLPAIEDPAVMLALPQVLRPVVDMHTPPIRCQLGNNGVVLVRFDGCSHQTGRLRAYVHCRHTDHTSCRCYRFVDLFNSQAHCAAWLTAWESERNKFPDKPNHLGHVPSDDLVNSVEVLNV